MDRAYERLARRAAGYLAPGDVRRAAASCLAQHRLELHGEPHVALDLDLAAHEGHGAVELAGGQVDEVGRSHADGDVRVLDAARATGDKAEQAKLYGRFQELVIDDGPGSVIYVQNFACGFSNKVRDVVVSPLMLLDFSKAALTA